MLRKRCFILEAVINFCLPVQFDVSGRMWNSIVSVPDHCHFIYFFICIYQHRQTCDLNERAGTNLSCTRAISVISHLISSQSLSNDGSRGTTDDVATIPFHLSPSSAALREIPKAHFCPLCDVIFPFLLLSSSPACSFHCPLQNWLCHARGS